MGAGFKPRCRLNLGMVLNLPKQLIDGSGIQARMPSQSRHASQSRTKKLNFAHDPEIRRIFEQIGFHKSWLFSAPPPSKRIEFQVQLVLSAPGFFQDQKDDDGARHARNGDTLRAWEGGGRGDAGLRRGNGKDRARPVCTSNYACERTRRIPGAHDPRPREAVPERSLQAREAEGRQVWARTLPAGGGQLQRLRVFGGFTVDFLWVGYVTTKMSEWKCQNGTVRRRLKTRTVSELIKDETLLLALPPLPLSLLSPSLSLPLLPFSLSSPDFFFLLL